MWRSKKFILIALLAAVVVGGSIGGVALAQTGNGDDSQPEAQFGALIDKVCAIYKDSTGDDINPEALKAAFVEARGEMWAERPESKLLHEPLTPVFESLGVDQEAVQAAFDQARNELEDGTLEGGERGALMSRVLEILGIDQQDWQAACAEVRQAHQEMCGKNPEDRPFGPGFGFHGPGGRPHDWGGTSPTS